MEYSVKSIRLSWDFLRGIAGFTEFLTFAIIAAMIPPQLGVLRIPALIVGVVISALAAFKCSLMWARIALISEISFFFIPITWAVFSSASSVVPVLLLAFVMMMFSEHIVSLFSEYRHQFSTLVGERVLDFNSPALGRSLAGLYRRLARNGILYACCYVITIGVLLTGLGFSRVAPILSDVSLYILVISISLALLVVMKED
jgi:small-conductance mechanosensitive channel